VVDDTISPNSLRRLPRGSRDGHQRRRWRSTSPIRVALRGLADTAGLARTSARVGVMSSFRGRGAHALGAYSLATATRSFRSPADSEQIAHWPPWQLILPKPMPSPRTASRWRAAVTRLYAKSRWGFEPVLSLGAMRRADPAKWQSRCRKWQSYCDQAL